jgi:hypothetical protein
MRVWRVSTNDDRVDLVASACSIRTCTIVATRPLLPDHDDVCGRVNRGKGGCNEGVRRRG